MLILSNQEIAKITDHIFISDSLEKADIGLVFGNRHDEPVYEAVRLFKAGFFDKVLFSGGINKITGENEAERMMGLAISLGLLKENITQEKTSTNTLENVLNSLKILEPKIASGDIKSVLAITKHYHARRALMTLKKHFPRNIKFIMHSYELYGFCRDNWYKKELGLQYVLKEREKISKYLAQGDLKDI